MAKLLRAQKMRADDSCETMTKLIADYLNGRLKSRLRRAFEAHLQICPDCVSFLNTYRKTASLGTTVNAGDIPANVRASVLAFLRRKMREIAVFLLSLLSQAAS